MAKKGRPSVLTEEMQDKILSYFAIGLNMTQVAAYAGVDYETLRKFRKRNPAFDNRCSNARLTKLVIAHRNEMELLRSGDFRATQAVLAREERAEVHRRAEAMRRAEIQAVRKSQTAGGDGILPAVLDMSQIVAEINDAFNGKPESEQDDNGKTPESAKTELDS